MINLTTPIPIVSSLSGTTVGYNKIRVVNVTFDMIGQGVTANLELLVAADPTKPAILGKAVINTQGTTPQLVVSFDSLRIPPQVVAIPTLVAAIQTLLTNFQTQVENALISQGVLPGTQVAGN